MTAESPDSWLMPRAHRIWTLSFGPGVGSDLRADREPTLGFDTAGPEAQPYHSINSRKAQGRWYNPPEVLACERFKAANCDLKDSQRRIDRPHGKESPIHPRPHLGRYPRHRSRRRLPGQNPPSELGRPSFLLGWLRYFLGGPSNFLGWRRCFLGARSPVLEEPSFLLGRLRAELGRPSSFLGRPRYWPSARSSELGMRRSFLGEPSFFLGGSSSELGRRRVVLGRRSFFLSGVGQEACFYLRSARRGTIGLSRASPRLKKKWGTRLLPDAPPDQNRIGDCDGARP